MNEILSAIYSRLTSSALLVSMVGELDGGPSIFSTQPIAPANATDSEKEAIFPMVQIEDVVTDVPFDTKTSEGREVVVDVGCYAIQDGSLIKINELAAQVRSLFDTDLTVNGYSTVLTMVVGGPVPSDGDRVYGRIITVRLILEKE